MYGTCGRIDNKADFDFDFDKIFHIKYVYLYNPNYGNVGTFKFEKKEY